MERGLDAIRRQMLAGDDSALAAVEVARRIELATRRDYARRVADARTAGATWEQIAGAAPGFVAAFGAEAGDAVFNEVAVATARAGERYVAWRCGSCDGLVLDRGPAGSGHPDDTAPGHADACDRRAADVARYVALLDGVDLEPDPPSSHGRRRGRDLEPW